MTASSDRPGATPYPPPPPYPGALPVRPRNGLGVASLVFACAALLLSCSVVLGVVFGIVGAVLGVVGHKRAQRGEANNGGMAIAGIVLGIMGAVVGLAFVPIWIAVSRESGVGNYVDCLQNAGSDRARQQQCVDQFRDRVQDQFGVTVTPTPPP